MFRVYVTVSFEKKKQQFYRFYNDRTFESYTIRVKRFFLAKVE